VRRIVALLWTAALAAIFSIATAASPVRAQALSSSSDVVTLTVRPGRDAEMEQFLERLAEAARRTGVGVRWRTHRRVEGDRPVYLLVLRGAETDLDAWRGLTPTSILERAFGEREARRILALREQSLERMTRERFVARPDLGSDE
jgi:hypothetical protein